MSYNIIEFMTFLFVIYIFYMAVNNKYKIPYLFVVSVLVIIYMSIPLLIYGSIILIVNYFGAIYIDKEENKPYRKIVYFIAQTLNIGGLLLFKYINFIISYVNRVLDFVDVSSTIPYMHLINIIGVSYFTFQSISYQYLVFKSGDKPEKDFFKFGFYMFFFAKLVAGPIERHRKFFPQMKNYNSFKIENLVGGLQLLLWGAFKKFVIADPLGSIIEVAFRSSDTLGSLNIGIVFLLLPVYLYSDFSGYTDMARGIGRMFGFNLNLNFNYPFFSKNVAEFWRRWHISLSSWCNDFIFARLLLKHRKWNKFAFVYAVTITFIVIGIWHGANFNYVILGILQAIAITYEFLTKKQRVKIGKKLKPIYNHIFSSIFVYLFYAVSLVFFLTPNISSALKFLHDAFLNWQGFKLSGFDIIEHEIIITGIAIIIVFVAELKSYSRNLKMDALLPKSYVLRWFLYALAFLLVVYYSKYENLFVYAEF